MKYQVFLFSLLKCILSFFGIQLPWAEHNSNNLWFLAVISASLLGHSSGMVWRDGNHKSGLPHLEWIFSIFIWNLFRNDVKSVLVDELHHVSFHSYGKYVVFSDLAQTIHFSYPSHGIKKVRDFYNPLANSLRTVEFFYLSPLSWPYRKYGFLMLIVISLRVGDTH